MPAPVTFQRILMAAALLVIGLSGCNTPTKPKVADKDAKNEEYVWYTPTGSTIAKRVRKSDVEAADGNVDQTQRDLSSLQQRGQKQPSDRN